jgi:translocation and assembly module TamB
MTERDEPTEQPAMAEPAPQQPATKARRSGVRRVLAALAWIVVSLAAIVLSLGYHLGLPQTRSFMRVLIEGLASDALAGSLEIGRIDELGLGRARFTDVVLRDPQGRVVIHAMSVTAWPDLARLMADGTIRIAAGHVEDGEVVLYVEGEDGLEVSLVQAFLPASPSPPGGEPIHIIIDGLEVDRVLLHGDAPRYPGVRLEDTHMLGRIDIEEEVRIEVYEGRGRMTGPYEGETSIDDIVLSFTTDRLEGLNAYAEASRGETRARARALVTWPDEAEDAPPHIVITASAEPVCMRTLEEMGFPGLDNLEGCATGFARLEGSPSLLEVTANLATDAGALDVTGGLPDDGRYWFEARTEGVDLARLVPASPELRFRGRARIEIDVDESTPARARFELDGDPFSVSGYEIPSISARGSVEDERIVLDELTSPHLSGSISGGGVIGFDGAIDVHIEVDVADAGNDPNIARLVPGAHGPARGGIDVVLTANAEDMDVRWNLVFSPFRYGPVRARRLATRGRAHGPSSALHIDADAVAEGTTASGIALGHVEAEIHGGPGPYTIRARSRGGRDIREAHTVLTLRTGGGVIDLEIPEYAADFGLGMIADRAHPVDGTSPVDVPAAQIRVRGNVTTIENLELVGEGRRLSARGAIDTRGSGSDLHVEAEGLQVALLRPFLPERFALVAGVGSATLDLAGDLDDPDVSLSGRVVDATLDGARTFGLALRFEYSDSGLYAHVDGDLGDTGSVRIDGPVAVSWAALTDPGGRLLDELRFDGLEIDIDRINIAFITPFLGERVRDLGIAGKITVAMQLAGTIDDLQVPWAVVILDNFALPNTSTVRMKLEGSLAEHLLTLDQVWLADAAGELARASASLTLPLDDLPGDVPSWVRAIASEPWSLRLEVADRRLEGWPRPLAKYLPRGVLVQGALELHGSREGVTAHLDSNFRWDEAASADACAADVRPRIELTADSDLEGHTEGQLTVLIDEVVVATGTTSGDTPIGEWLLAGVTPVTPATELALHVDGLALERLPWTCASTSSGEVRGDVSATLFVPEPNLRGELTIDGLRVRTAEDAPPSAAYHAEMRVSSTGSGLNAVETCLVLGREDGARTPLASCPSAASLRSSSTGAIAEDGELIAVASLPVSVFDGAVVPAIEWEQDMFAVLDAQHAALEPLLVWIPGVAQANALADGTVRAEGPWESLQLDGGLLIHDGEARIVALGQYLHDIGGPLRFEGNHIILPEDRPWEAWDGDHLLRLSGDVTMRGLIPTHIDAVVRPTSFPVRREGAILASLTGDASLSADVFADRFDADVTTGSLLIELPQSTAGATQDLALLPEVLVIGEDSPELLSRGIITFPYHIHLDASRSFTVRRNDFEVQVTSNLDVTYRDPELLLSGVAVIRRGTFEILGKRFAVTRGSLTFGGGAELDPAVDLVATYELPGRSGSSISVIASGTLLDIHIDFQSTESSDTGEILALLVSGRASRATDPQAAQQAGEQTANFVSGLLAGVLTLGLREQFGSVVPNISLETGGRGSVAARVGFDADWIIPDFLREVVLGAYFEGTVGSDARNAVSYGGVGLGVTLELQFPFNFVGTGSYSLPQNGGLDILWDAF